MFNIKKVESIDVLQLITIVGHSIKLMNLQLTDDTLLFVPLTWQVVWNYLRIKDIFGIMSGLYLNITKTNIIIWNRSSEFIAKHICEALNCEHLRTLTTYLGLPLGANPKRLMSWELVIVKVERKLSSWRARLLSKPGRLVLIKNVFSVTCQFTI